MKEHYHTQKCTEVTSMIMRFLCEQLVQFFKFSVYKHTLESYTAINSVATRYIVLVLETNSVQHYYYNISNNSANTLH